MANVISLHLQGELHDVLARLRAARALNPKHGTRAGAPDCDDRCQICFNRHYFNYLIDQIPRPVEAATKEPTQ